MPNIGASNKLVLAFITLIIGVVLVGVIATQTLIVTERTVVNNEVVDISSARLVNNSINESFTFTVTNNPTTWKIVDCPLTDVTYGNSSDDYTLTTDYLITLSSGVFTLVNTSTTVDGSNDTFIDYTYCKDDYLNQGWGRSVLNIIAGFFAIALLLTSVALFFSIGKDYGLV